jgi:hypothetical protein
MMNELNEKLAELRAVRRAIADIVDDGSKEANAMIGVLQIMERDIVRGYIIYEGRP